MPRFYRLQKNSYVFEQLPSFLWLTNIDHTSQVVALGQMQARGRMHRDIKPSNILVDRRGHLVLSDFGLVCRFGDYERRPVGTLYYMAPEVVKRRRYDSQCDIWSLGLVLYELHTQMTQPYFAREGSTSRYETIARILGERIDFDRIANPLARTLIRKVRPPCQCDVYPHFTDFFLFRCLFEILPCVTTCMTSNGTLTSLVRLGKGSALVLEGKQVSLTTNG